LTKVVHDLFPDESAAADDDDFHVVLLIRWLLIAWKFSVCA
jgi:hypothetical protein